MFLSQFIQRIQRAFAPEPIMTRAHILPLPCPEHKTAFIPERKVNGEWGLFCPLCRLACQPVEEPLEPEDIIPLDKRLITPLVPARNVRPGNLMSAERAKKRVVKRLLSAKHRLVLIGDTGNNKPGDTNALSFANDLTEHMLPRVRKMEA